MLHNYENYEKYAWEKERGWERGGGDLNDFSIAACHKSVSSIHKK